jgi:hypothetical protein
VQAPENCANRVGACTYLRAPGFEVNKKSLDRLLDV